jgi:hypothetical protein
MRDRQREYAYVSDEELTRNFLTEEWERMKRKEKTDPLIKRALRKARRIYRRYDPPNDFLQWFPSKNFMRG